ncbi:MAG TPA: Uma2 family endonuclease [Rhodopila sp.]|nr:Uma2 family endonuclease [Rhodopila sp.]
MTLSEYLEWERRQEGYYEFDGQNIVPMNGGTSAHWIIQSNLMGALHSGLHGHRCRVYGSGMKIRTATGVRYPDAFIVCSPVPPDADYVADPVIVFEILSPSTATVDHIDKNQEYRDTPSIQRYIILEQTKIAATVFTRQGDAWVWSLQIGDTTLDLPEIGLSLRLPELYEGVTQGERGG